MADQQTQDPQQQQVSAETGGPPNPIAGDPYQSGPSETPQQDAEQQAHEVELRDIAGACIADALEVYMKAGKAALGNNDLPAAKEIAQAVLSLTQAVVLLAPLEHTPDATSVNGQVAAVPRHMPPQVSATFSEQAMAQHQTGTNAPTTGP